MSEFDDKFDDFVKYDYSRALEIIEQANVYIEWVHAKNALEELPQRYGKLLEEYKVLGNNFRERRRENKNLKDKVATLESEKANLKGRVATLESEKTKLQREKINLEGRVATLESEKANLETKYESMREANRKLTENNPHTAGGDSATTYLQWIERYITLLQDYNDKVYDVVTQTDDNIAAIRDLVVQILEEGFSSGVFSPNTKARLQSVRLFIDPKYREGTREYQYFVQFFEDLMKLVQQAEDYKNSFYVFVPSLDSHFDQRYARLPGLERPRKQDDKNKWKKITRCYLPTVLFFFTTEYLAACAPGLVEVEKEKPKRPEPPTSDNPHSERRGFDDRQPPRSTPNDDFRGNSDLRRR